MSYFDDNEDRIIYGRTNKFFSKSNYSDKRKETMQVQGKVVESQVNVQVPKKGGGTYPGCMLTYRGADGKVAEQAFHENAFKYNAPLLEVLKTLAAGDTFVMEKEKKGDFWNVVSITKTDGMSAAPAASAASASASKPAGKVLGSTYETPEERAKKQVYIVRQSSITAALGYFTLNKTAKATTEDILAIAKEFEKYVFASTELETDPVQGVVDMEDDVPQ